VRGKAPEGPEGLCARLLDQLPAEESIWTKLGESYEVQLRFALHKTGWNRGFDFSPGMVARIARLRARVVIEIYADDHLAESDEELTEIAARCDEAMRDVHCGDNTRRPGAFRRQPGPSRVSSSTSSRSAAGERAGSAAVGRGHRGSTQVVRD
jgi:hypothetical protein